MQKKSMYSRILAVGLPLVVSMSSTTIMEFTDRLFLGWYSLETLAAATPAAILALLFVTIFFGTGSYVSVFVAQYIGSKQREMVGLVLWQAIYLVIGAALFIAFLTLWLPEFFALVGHGPELQRMEVSYCRILCWGAGVQLGGVVLSAFFSGQGRTRVVMVANLIGMFTNIPLNYTLINGFWIFPELGIVGAGLATVVSWGVITLLLAGQAFTAKNERVFCIRSARRFSRKLFVRLMYYGIPNGIIFFMEIFSFSVFVFIIGKLGTVVLAASNITMTINSIAFLPLIGMSIAASVLTGQAIGSNKKEQLSEILGCTLKLVGIYLSGVAIIFIFFPEIFISIFGIGQQGSFDQVALLVKNMLRFVVFYLFFDGLTYSVYGILKGTGDTWFVMISQIVCAFVAMVIPLGIGLHFNLGVYYFWGCVCFYIVVLSMTALVRYLRGKWLLHILKA